MKRRVITQIGSLPYKDIGKAIEYSLEHDIPFLPELPKRGEYMLDYIKNPGKLICLKEFKKYEFETVKIQCVGPTTLILKGYSKEEAVERAFKHIYGIMDGLNAKEVILFLDEPVLGQVGFGYKELWEPLFDYFKVVWGVHTCGNMDWDELFDSNIEIISFDASQYDIKKYSKKYRNGKRIAWGIERRGDVKDFQEGDLLTLPCGMSPKLYQVKDCERNLEMLVKVSEECYSKASPPIETNKPFPQHL